MSTDVKGLLLYLKTLKAHPLRRCPSVPRIAEVSREHEDNAKAARALWKCNQVGSEYRNFVEGREGTLFSFFPGVSPSEIVRINCSTHLRMRLIQEVLHYPGLEHSSSTGRRVWFLNAGDLYLPTLAVYEDSSNLFITAEALLRPLQDVVPDA